MFMRVQSSFLKTGDCVQLEAKTTYHADLLFYDSRRAADSCSFRWCVSRWSGVSHWNTDIISSWALWWTGAGWRCTVLAAGPTGLGSGSGGASIGWRHNVMAAARATVVGLFDCGRHCYDIGHVDVVAGVVRRRHVDINVNCQPEQLQQQQYVSHDTRLRLWWVWVARTLYYITLFFRRILISQFPHVENSLHFNFADYSVNFIKQFVSCFFSCL